MPDPVKILLAEDDINLGFVVKDNLEHHGFSVDLCKDGREATEHFRTNRYDVCILDIMMPKIDGFELASDIRAKDTQIPILFVSAKTLKEDRLHGFLLGGDDYITKPFSIEELICRIRVFLKRTQSNISRQDLSQPLGKYTFNHAKLALNAPGSDKMLTQKEADILQILCEAKGEVVKRRDILIKVWGDDDYFIGRSLDVFISKLRKYLADDPDVQITNHHGVGFKLKID